MEIKRTFNGSDSGKNIVGFNWFCTTNSKTLRSTKSDHPTYKDPLVIKEGPKGYTIVCERIYL